MLFVRAGLGAVVSDLISLQRGVIEIGAESNGDPQSSGQTFSHYGGFGLLSSRVVDPVLGGKGSILAANKRAGAGIDRRFLRELDDARDAFASTGLTRVWAGTASAMSAGMSILYFLWTLRAGSLVSSLLSSMPAWTMVDPLPILETMGGAGGALKGEDDQGLEELVQGGGD